MFLKVVLVVSKTKRRRARQGQRALPAKSNSDLSDSPADAGVLEGLRALASISDESEFHVRVSFVVFVKLETT